MHSISIPWLRQSSLVLPVAVLMLTSQACALDASREKELIHLVRQDCGSCHGMTLKGGLGGALLPETLSEADSSSIAAIILNGVPGKPMPGWRGLITAEEARWIADKLKEGFPQ